LSAEGMPTLSDDAVVFTTHGEPASAASLLVQGDAYLLAGATYGQGVRCVGGKLRRLFSRSAVGGGAVFPDFGAGDPSVSVRSASRGDTISPGGSRWYFVYYRDKAVLGGCPMSGAFNATQARQATW